MHDEDGEKLIFRRRRTKSKKRIYELIKVKNSSEIEDAIQKNKKYDLIRCVPCMESFTAPNSLKRHRLIHYRDFHQCKSCPSHYDKREKLAEHIRLVHEPQKEFWCNYCYKTYQKAKTLNN